MAHTTTLDLVRDCGIIGRQQKYAVVLGAVAFASARPMRYCHASGSVLVCVMAPIRVHASDMRPHLAHLIF